MFGVITEQEVVALFILGCRGANEDLWVLVSGSLGVIASPPLTGYLSPL